MLKRLITLSLITLSLVFAAWASQPAMSAFADTPQQEVCKGVGAATGSGCASSVSLTKVIRNVINIFSIVVGIVAVIMIIISGFKFVTAGGDTGNVTSARQTLLYAVVGIVVTALSQFIVWFVLNNID